MVRFLIWTGIVVVLAFTLDWLLLGAERRGWIYYRRTRPVRGVSTYHIRELTTMLGGEGIPEIQEEVQHDDSGPPA